MQRILRSASHLMYQVVAFIFCYTQWFSSVRLSTLASGIGVRIATYERWDLLSYLNIQSSIGIVTTDIWLFHTRSKSGAHFCSNVKGDKFVFALVHVDTYGALRPATLWYLAGPLSWHPTHRWRPQCEPLGFCEHFLQMKITRPYAMNFLDQERYTSHRVSGRTAR